jgi:hypothetical protein
MWKLCARGGPALALFVAGGVFATAQTLPPTAIPQTKADYGQDVVPSFDGWIKNPDGTISFVFGYMNRNYKEELAIPAGPDNRVEPGPGLDQGQPTYFLPRRHAWVFQVKVPGNWSEKELVWSITSHGRTEKAFATLQMELELLPRVIQSRGNLNPGLDDPNKAPSISIAPVAQAVVGSPVTLTAMVTDDGLPKLKPPKPPAPPEPGKAPAQTNSANARPRLPLNVTWMPYRAPAKVSFEKTDPIIVADGKAVTTARFRQPGTYVLRATANDGELVTPADVTITVSGP